MIISHIVGGLGNQLFQYAAGLQLANFHNTELVLDTLDYHKYPDRFYELDNYKIRSRVARRNEVQMYRLMQKFPFNKLPPNLLSYIPPFWNKYLYMEPSFEYDSHFSSIPDNSYLVGHFVSYKYFQKISTKILEDIRYLPSLSKETKMIKQVMSNTKSIAVHVRRGDYVSVPKFNQKHGLLSAKYYSEAKEKIVNELGKDCVFYIFSDDINWCKNNLHFSVKTEFVSDKTLNQHEDLELMRSCKHAIIANSTFSWWGAWLQANKKKLIIYPKKWDRVEFRDYTSLAPKEWVSL